MNAVEQGMFIHFVNFHALVNVGSADHGTNSQVLKFETDLIKVGHTSKEEASSTN